MPDGIVLIDKEKGESSFNVVRDVRRILKEKKVGHAGTLDPFATGLLVILLGQGTKLFPYLTSMDKEYEAVLRLGIETDTLDETGRIVRAEKVPPLDAEFVRGEAKELIGEIEQIPPAFSAVRCGGKRAYELARKGVLPALEKRVVRIHRLEITSIDLPDVTMTVRCSKGTYIRSLGSELGRRLGPGGHLKSLRRISIGPFTVSHAIHRNDSGLAEKLGDRIIPLTDALPHMREVEVSRGTGEMIEKGFPANRWEGEILSRLPDSVAGPVKLVREGKLLAILKRLPVPEGKGCLELMRVFV
ncbi:MAG: tRNA pseudouridine(55) synthase TruB [Desulfobacteraceae bacterium]|nr:MAG: tRNA pseudouridine(55) synthase TruB [Desulfobacteraceae bacterium]